MKRFSLNLVGPTNIRVRNIWRKFVGDIDPLFIPIWIVLIWVGGGGRPKDLVLVFKKKYSLYLRHRAICDLVFYYILQVIEIKHSKIIR